MWCAVCLPDKSSCMKLACVDVAPDILRALRIAWIESQCTMQGFDPGNSDGVCVITDAHTGLDMFEATMGTLEDRPPRPWLLSGKQR